MKESARRLANLWPWGSAAKRALREQGKCFEFVAADGQSENREIGFAGAQELEKGRRDFFDHRELDLRIFSRKSRESLRKKVRRNRWDYADRDGAANGILLFDDIAARCFEFAEDGAGSRKKGLPCFREAHGTAEAVEEARAEFILEFHDLLRKRRLRHVRLLGGAAERTGLGDSAEVAKLMKLHRLCLSIVSELYIGSIAAARVPSVKRAEFRAQEAGRCKRTEEESWRKKKR